MFTWLYNNTGGSILMVALWHGAYNATATATEPTIAAIVNTFWKTKPSRPLSNASGP